ncbi:uncharacterized protein OCT59_021208 [Rhizophagus irregularis]|uniref:uncharacterized protein n=1 Tax=Rhizophagus irregularis TaxID=588596 RepID=UPI00332F8A04|nr:hypothetical protein OCT59_021208 [Rhizophagus irregularis]
MMVCSSGSDTLLEKDSQFFGVFGHMENSLRETGSKSNLTIISFLFSLAGLWHFDYVNGALLVFLDMWEFDVRSLDFLLNFLEHIPWRLVFQILGCVQSWNFSVSSSWSIWTCGNSTAWLFDYLDVWEYDGSSVL